MKTADLIGAELDYWVARAEGYMLHRYTNGWGYSPDKGERWFWLAAYCPSRNWATGGEIIDANAIGFQPLSDAEWLAEEYITANQGRGLTPLVAAMRCYVRSKFGDEVLE